MATIAESLRIDSAGVAGLLQQASLEIKGGANEVEVDFTSVRRIDPRSLRTLEQLAGEAENKTLRVALRGVNIDVYKVMKLAQLVPRFIFRS